MLYSWATFLAQESVKLIDNEIIHVLVCPIDIIKRNLTLMLMNIFIRVSRGQMTLKFWPILFKSLNGVMLMTIHFILKTVFRTDK